MKQNYKLLLFSLFITLQVNAQFYYNVNQDLRKQIVLEELKELDPLTPQKSKKTVALIFNSNLIFRQYEESLTKKNLKPNDIALVYSFFKSSCEKFILDEALDGNNVKENYTKMNDQLEKYFNSSNPGNEVLQRKYDGLVLKAGWLAIVKPNLDKKSMKNIAENFLVENELIDNTQTTIIKKDPKNRPIAKASIKNSFNNINEIIMRTVTSYGLSGVYVYNEICVLYKNGDLFTNPSEPLEVFNIAESKRTKPKKWKTWKKSQGKIQVTNTSTRKVYDWKKWFKTRPGNKGDTFNGLYETIDPFGGSTVINASTVYFDNKGRFAWSNLKGGSWNMNSVYIKSKYKGTYYISNYTINLNYDNGKKESFFFCRYPVSNKHFIIGQSHFVPVE